MYIPKQFEAEDFNDVVAFMQRYNFAPIISVSNHRPVATHLPFVVEREEDDIVLTSHFARANKQWEDIASKEVLCIFSEPHAYISPKNYEQKENVPTWNYISVHAYGKTELVSDEEEVMLLLEKMIHTFEPDYFNQWQNLSEVYKHKMMNGITAFRIYVHQLLANEKLSQNKNETERKSIIEDLAGSSLESERTIADYMEKKYNQE